MSDRMVIYDEQTGKMLTISKETMKKRIDALNNEMFEKFMELHWMSGFRCYPSHSYVLQLF